MLVPRAGRCVAKIRATTSPPPLRGRDREGGPTSTELVATPLPAPPPQGGREQTAVASLSELVHATQAHQSLHLLDVHADGAAAGESDLPGGLVGDAEFESLGLAALDHVDRLGHDRALDAAARHRAEKIALAVDDQAGADRARRRAPGLDHRGERNRAALAAPFLGGLQDIVLTCQHLKVLQRITLK